MEFNIFVSFFRCCKNRQQNQANENAGNQRKWKYIFRKEEKELNT